MDLLQSSDLQTQVSQLSTCVINVIKMCKNNRAVDKERETRRQGRQGKDLHRAYKQVEKKGGQQQGW